MLSKYRILKGDLRERGVCFLLPSDEAKTLSEIVSDGRWDKYDPIVSAICGSLRFDITEAMHQDKKQYFLEVTQGEILGITDDGLMLDYASSFCEPCIALWIESKEEAVEKVWGLINLLKEKK